MWFEYWFTQSLTWKHEKPLKCCLIQAAVQTSEGSLKPDQDDNFRCVIVFGRLQYHSSQSPKNKVKYSVLETFKTGFWWLYWNILLSWVFISVTKSYIDWTVSVKDIEEMSLTSLLRGNIIYSILSWIAWALEWKLQTCPLDVPVVLDLKEVASSLASARCSTLFTWPGALTHATHTFEAWTQCT